MRYSLRVNIYMISAVHYDMLKKLDQKPLILNHGRLMFNISGEDLVHASLTATLPDHIIKNAVQV